MLVVSDQVSDRPGQGEENEMSVDAREEPEMADVVLHSINSVVRLSNPKKMKVKGRIAQCEVVVLIDSRAGCCH